MKDCPASEEMMEDPPDLKVQLMAHQKKALRWMLWKETQIPSGGILGETDWYHFIGFPQHWVVCESDNEMSLAHVDSLHS